MTKPKIIHNTALFEALQAKAKGIDPSIRKGHMFGCPAIFHGKRMAVCVYGDVLGLKVPEAIASSYIDAGAAIPFQPYGKNPMREWIAIEGGVESIEAHIELITTAIAYAETR